MNASLFQDDLDEAAIEPSPPAPAKGPFAGVALEQSIDRVLDYSIPHHFVNSLRPGQRVRVPLGRGNRMVFGYVVTIHETTRYPRIKPLHSIADDRVLVNAKLMELARWMSKYYCCSLGAVIGSIVPSAVTKRTGLGYAQIVRLAVTREVAQETLEKTKAPKRRAILARLLQLVDGDSIEIVRLAGEAGATPATVRKLVRLGLITVKSEADLPRLTANITDSLADEPFLTLNDEQQAAFDELKPRVLSGDFNVNLLRGVTGSGKTELYLRCIREVVERGKGAIVLVPEIALTPQTVRRFTARFKRVAILHSGLSATERHRFWQQISQGLADVVVGARSAVFAPVPNLGILVVDEEHESSYKQDTAPRYHARDVAIKRAQLENVPVILGSATPSLETWRKVMEEGGGKGIKVEGDKVSRKDGDAFSSLETLSPSTVTPSPSSFHLVSLANRVKGLSLPHVELIDMKQEAKFRRGIHLLSQRLEALLRSTIDAGHQAILLLNRRGYSNFVYCPSCTHLMGCKYCDTTMTYHRSADAQARNSTLQEGIHTGQLHCHYCLAVNPLPGACPACGKKMSLFGLGTQRVEEEITRKFPDLKFARVDSDTMRSAKDYEALLARFGRKEVQVMLGTQMIAKGLDYPNVTLVGVISGDTALSLPDFRAAERTFQLITQVAGRAGRGEFPGRVVLQTFQPQDTTIQHAIKQDFLGFAKQELGHRKQVGLPPYGRMVRIILRDEELETLHDRGDALEAVLTEAVTATGGVTMKGPMPCAIARIAGYHRSQVVLSSPQAARLQNVLSLARDKGAFTQSDRVAVDVDPVSLL